MGKHLKQLWINFYTFVRSLLGLAASETRNVKEEAKQDIENRQAQHAKAKEEVVQLKKQINLDENELKELSDEVDKFIGLAKKAQSKGDAVGLDNFKKEVIKLESRERKLKTSLSYRNNRLAELILLLESFESTIADEEFRLAELAAMESVETIRSNAAHLLAPGESKLGVLEEHVTGLQAENNAREDLSMSTAEKLAKQYEVESGPSFDDILASRGASDPVPDTPRSSTPAPSYHHDAGSTYDGGGYSGGDSGGCDSGSCD